MKPLLPEPGHWRTVRIYAADMRASLLGPPREDCTVVTLDGRVSVYSPRSREVYVLSESATAVWLLLDGTRTFEELVESVAMTYATTCDAVRNDVVDLVTQLFDDGLLDRVPVS